MDYLPAIYILTLALELYVAIKLHANNCVIVVKLWNPFARCFSRLRRQVNPQASVIYAFAIFLLLAYSSIVQTSMYLLLPTGVYNINGTLLRLVMLFDGTGTIDYFFHDHTHFCYIALLLMVTALLPPLLYWQYIS